MVTPAKFALALVAGVAMLGLLALYVILRDDIVREDTAISTADGRSATRPVAVPDARLSGPTDCVTGPFRVRVSGSEVTRVSFAVDGERRQTVDADASGQASMRIDPRGKSTRVHRVTADARFRDSDIRPETMTLIYQRRDRTAANIRFAG
jgi:hypothetical protein